MADAPTFVDYNPDHYRSGSALWIEQRPADIIEVLQVRNLGVVVFRATDDPLEFKGISIFTDQDIGWRH